MGDLLASTWAECRTAIGNGAATTSGGPHNIEWTDGFMSAAGNGLFRCDPAAALAFARPYFSTGGNFLLQYSNLYNVLDQEEADQLIGETVTSTGPPAFLITSAYITAGGQGDIAGYPILSVGKLTVF